MSKNLYAAGAVRRWHKNPAMTHVHDPVEAHSGRVARWLALWHPDASSDLLCAALAHDDGEWRTGDLSPATKDAMPPHVRGWLAFMEREGRVDVHGYDPLDHLTTEESDWLRLADRVDAYHMVLQHAPQETLLPEWTEAREWIDAEARRLGIPRHAIPTYMDPED